MDDLAEELLKLGYSVKYDDQVDCLYSSKLKSLEKLRLWKLQNPVRQKRARDTWCANNKQRVREHKKKWRDSPRGKASKRALALKWRKERPEAYTEAIMQQRASRRALKRIWLMPGTIFRGWHRWYIPKVRLK